MAQKQDIVIDKVRQFYLLIKDIYPIKKVLLYGSYAKGTASKDSDVDVGVVMDVMDGKKKVELTSELFRYARKIDVNIEPKCIFWDEYVNREKASILSEIAKSAIEVKL